MFLPRSVTKKAPPKKNIPPQNRINTTSGDVKTKEDLAQRIHPEDEVEEKQKPDQDISTKSFDKKEKTEDLGGQSFEPEISGDVASGSCGDKHVPTGNDGSDISTDSKQSQCVERPASPPASHHPPALRTFTESAEHLETPVPDADPIVSYSKNQRWPEYGEPVCVICGRYGEYICDKTEAGICSLECKARNLTRMKQGGDDKVKPSEKMKEDGAVNEASQGEIVESYSYTECLEISRMTREQLQDVRAEFDIFVEGLDIPRPVLSFEQLFLPSKLLENLKDANYLTPTPVQMQVIPAALKARNLMVCAQTSSGKTASYVIPSILHVIQYQSGDESDNGPFVLIVLPTRELAAQIEDQTKTLMKGIPNMKTALVVGGMPLRPQLHRLKQKIQVVIGTPGKLLMVLSKNGLCLSSIKLLVIDEVDSMLHRSFQEQINSIKSQLPDTYQTMLFSATIPASIEQIAVEMLPDPVFVSIGTPSTPCSSVKQILLWVEDPSKKKTLFNLLEDPKHYQPPILIFVDSKVGADLLAEAIEKVFGLDVAALHSDKTQVERTSILQSFQEGLVPVLVSTAVLGRGLDLPKVKMVINFDMPNSVEEYIHQIGRTGRLGTKGTAITFINNGSKKLFLELQKTVKPLGVALPNELINSPFLHLQREEHQNKGKNMKRSGDYRGWKDFKRRKHIR